MYFDDFHGVEQLRQSTSIPARILWTSLVASCIGAAVLTTYDGLRDFFADYSYTYVHIRHVQFLKMPAVYVCPYYSDAINQTAVTVDIQEKLADTKNVDIRKLVAYAIAGAGLQYASSEILRKVSDEEMDVLKAQFRRWLNGSDPKKFFRNLFITNGYRCEELFLRCEHGGTELSCCKIFEPRFIMKRGRWFKLKQINQTAPNHYGQLSVTLGMLPSWILTPDGFQPTMVVHILSHRAEPYYTHRRHYAQRWEANEFVLKERDYHFLDTNPLCNSNDKRGDNRPALTCYYDYWLRTRLIEPFNCTFFYLTRGVDGLETCDPDLVVRNYQYMDAKAGDFKYKWFEEMLATNVPDFISELGGQSSLFVGASLVTFVKLLFGLEHLMHGRPRLRCRCSR